MDKLKKRADPSERKLLDVLENRLLAMGEDFGCRISNKKWKLSRREIEICELIRQGLTSKEVAEILFTSVKTIEHHRNRIRKKLGISKQSVDLTEWLKSCR